MTFLIHRLLSSQDKPDGKRNLTNDGSQASHQIAVLSAEVEHQRNQVEELDGKYRVTLTQLDVLTRKDHERQQEKRDLEKRLALLQHDLKEAQRKADYESDSRRKLDGLYQEVKKTLEDEQNKRTRDHNSAIAVNEKLYGLEKQLKEVQDKLKSESDNNSRLRKQHAELVVTSQRKESSLTEYTEKFATVQAMRDSLERDMVNLQTQLDQERTQKHHQVDIVTQTEGKVQALQAKLDNAFEREAVARKEAEKVSERLVQLEKDRNSLELELRGMTSRYEQEARALREASNAAPAHNYQSSAQALAALQERLNAEKQKRQQAEASSQEKECQNSMLSVDYRQLQQQLHKLEGEYRQECEKVKVLQKQVESESERRTSLANDLQSQVSEISSMRTREKLLVRDLEEAKEARSSLEEELHKLETLKSVDDVQMKELNDTLEAEQYFSTLYKTQVRELREEVDEKSRQVVELEEEHISLRQQLQLTVGRADAEALARSIAEETVAELEKEKTVKGLEIHDLLSRHSAEATEKDCALNAVKEREQELNKSFESLKQEKDALNSQVQLLEEEKKQTNKERQDELDKLDRQLKTEQLLKMQAVNKLAEIMARRENLPATRKTKASANDLRRKEKECRKLQQELTLERDKFSQTVAKHQKEVQEFQALFNDESQARTRLQMEVDSKDSEIESLDRKIANLNSETASLSSGADNDIDELDSRLEGWLSIPNKQNIKRHGWRRQYVVVSSRKIIFYNSENDKQNSDPILILDLTKVFHVRSVTQGDVIRAEAKDIPRIFQLLYAGEGESRKPGENPGPLTLLEGAGLDKAGTLVHKGHEFLAITFHMPTNCEVCQRHLWHMFKPPPALECKRCRFKIHRDHLDRKEDMVAPCKVNSDLNTAKELLLLAPSVDRQQNWVTRLSKKIQKSGYKAQHTTSTDGAKVSPRL
ncbi:Rho-associated protein kinase 2 [Chionoecetes opilio]|uniref:non-specific serine/threonine protein kinase n=1 Tax=Chionoecetes opilio TaxID=41210 RepID=A0A8J4XP09_CHIOP|nr:Rho-associated protein kinase 2 [Chionoecetes opilio]